MINQAAVAAWVAAGRRQGLRYHLGLPQQAASGRAGRHLGLGCGASVELHEHREYQPGDDLRHLDWNVSARSERPVVRLFREEVYPCLDLVVDGSRSMALAGTGKAAAAIGLAALLATAAEGSSWRHRTWYTGAGCELLTEGALVPAAWCTAGTAFTAQDNPARALVDRPPRWQRRSVRVLLSDLLWAGDPQPLLQRLVAGAAAAVLVQIVARADLEPPQQGNLQLLDVETGASLPVRLDTATAARYRQAMARHTGQWQETARHLGVAWASLTSDELVSAWDLAALLTIGLLEAAPA